MPVFWVVAPCRLVRFTNISETLTASIKRALIALPCCFHHQGDECPDVGGSKGLWNVGKLIPVYTALQPRRQSSSYSQPCEPRIIKCVFFSLTFVRNFFRFDKNLATFAPDASITAGQAYGFACSVFYCCPILTWFWWCREILVKFSNFRSRKSKTDRHMEKPISDTETFRCKFSKNL
jgi:hypothetical protein